MPRNRPSMHKEIHDKFGEMCRFGSSRHADKKTGIAAEGIYSYKTLQTYTQQVKQFSEWAKAAHRCKTMTDAQAFAGEYITKLRNEKKSAWTQQTARSALAKFYGINGVEIAECDIKRYGDVVRGKASKGGRSHFSEALHNDMVTFIHCTGLRRRGMTELDGGHEIAYREYFGAPCLIGIKEKGGKIRDVPIIGMQEEVAAVIEKIKSTPKGQKVWPTVSKAAPVHKWRGEYAKRLYMLLARDVSKEAIRSGKVSSREVYICRGSKAGVRYCRAALRVVSKAMGHERVSVVAMFYL